MLKVAVIGCGSIARSQHIPAFMHSKDAEIRYFCDIIPKRAQAAADACGLGTAITDYRVALADPALDAISVCTPNDMHAKITIDALRAGKHVLCEKPAARTYQEALEMQAAQHETGKLLLIGVVNRFNEGVNRIKRMIDQGRLGRLYHVCASFRAHRSIPGLGGAFTTRAIAGGGALIDWGVHFLDIVMYCAGDPAPLTVSGETFCELGKDMRAYVYKDMWAGPPDYDGVYDVEDSVTGLIRTRGPVISLHGAWAQNIGEQEMYIDFMGDKGGVRLHYGNDFTFYSDQDGALISMTPQFTAENPFQREIDTFVHCAASGGKPASHIDTTIITARIMQTVYDSAATHREIVLEEG